MTDEMKLLMALCDALNFDVTENVTTSKYNTGVGIPPKIIDVKHTEYKLTKRVTHIPLYTTDQWVKDKSTKIE